LPYGGSSYSVVSLYASSPAGSPMPAHSPYSPASALPPLSGRRSPSGCIGTRSFPGAPAGLGLSPGFFPPASAGAAGALRTPATVATLSSPALGLGTPAFGHFSRYAALAFERPCGSTYAEGHGEEG
jgi:hypothetical protein